MFSVNGKNVFLNETDRVNLCRAITRALVAILELYQQKDGSVLVPEMLRAFVGKDVIQAEMQA